MRVLGNIIWHCPFCGFLSALFVFCLGLLLTALVVTAPIGLGLLQYAKFLLLPYSYDMVDAKEIKESDNEVWKSYSAIIKIIYLPIGLILAFLALLQVIGLFCSIIGIPVAIPLAKSLGTYVNPIGKICVSTDIAAAMRLEKASAELNKMQNQ